MPFFGSHNRHNGSSPEVNVTPLIDVSLTLVVMLIMTTPLAFESRIDVRGASETAKRDREKQNDPRVEIVLVSEDSVTVNRSILTRADLSGALRPLLDGREDRMVVVSCNDGVTHGAFVDVLDQAKVCGAGEIAVLRKASW